jgi:hypothetical protein
MARPQYYGSFESLQFPKTGAMIVTKARVLHKSITAKMKEREGRIRAAAKEMGLKDAGDVLMSMQSIANGESAYGNAPAANLNLTVGLAANMKSEIAEMDKERQETERLRLIIDNLPPREKFKLKFEELKYFGW